MIVTLAPMLARRHKRPQILEPRKYELAEQGTEHTEWWLTPRNGPWELRHLTVTAEQPSDVERIHLTAILIKNANWMRGPMPLAIAKTWYVYVDFPPKVSLQKTGLDFGLTLRWATAQEIEEHG